jgi:hypothetical protein
VVLFPGLDPIFNDFVILVISSEFYRDFGLFVDAEADGGVEFRPSGCFVKDSGGVEQDTGVKDVIVDAEKFDSIIMPFSFISEVFFFGPTSSLFG